MRALPSGTLRRALGRAVRELRGPDGRGYSQEGFADVVGLHRTYLGSVERGEVNVSLDNIERIAAGLGLSISALFAHAERLADPAPNPPAV